MGRQPSQQPRRQRNDLENDHRHREQDQRSRHGRPPAGIVAETLAGRPGPGRRHGQHRQRELANRMSPAHQHRHEKDHAAQAEIDELQQHLLEGLP